MDSSWLSVFLGSYALCLVLDFARVICEFIFGRRRKGMANYLYEDEVTFIIPCHNSADTIAGTLASLPPEYAAICVLNACADDTKGVIDKFVAENPERRVVAITTDKPGKIRAVTLGALHCETDYFVLLDDDVEWPQSVRPHRATRTGCRPFVSIKPYFFSALPVLTTVDKKASPLAAWQAFEYMSMCVSKFAQGAWGDTIMISGAAGIYHTRNYVRIAADHTGEHVGDDLQLSYLIHDAGYRIDFIPNLPVRTFPPSTLKQWWKQRAGRWERSPVSLLPLGLRLVFKKGQMPWIRWIVLYRILVMGLDVSRLVSIPVVLVTSPVVVVGVWAISWASLVLRQIFYAVYFAGPYIPVVQTSLTRYVFLLLTFPIYTTMMWLSRLAALPYGIASLVKQKNSLRKTFASEGVDL